MIETAKTASVRNFLRTLNLLLKAARMYGFDHVRTAEQCKAGWDSLREYLRQEGDLKIAVAGAKLLVDGDPLKTNPAESSFAQMLSAAGVSSLHFTAQATEEEFLRLARAFAESGSKFEGLTEKLRAALGGPGNGIRVNEVRFVEADSEAVAGSAEARVVGELASQALQAESSALREAASDPRKLLALLAAAMGADAHPSGSGATHQGPAHSSGTATDTGRDTAADALEMEEDVAHVVKVLGALGTAGKGNSGAAGLTQVQDEVRSMPASARRLLQSALQNLIAEDTASSNPMLLVQLAERMAIQVALRRVEREDAAGSAIRFTLNRMAQEIATLQKRLAEYEQKERAAAADESQHAEWLERQFWVALPEAAKCKLLLSPEAWNRPIAEVRAFLETLFNRGEKKKAAEILSHYATGVQSEEPAVRCAAAEGLSEMADLIAQLEESQLSSAICVAGTQLAAETDDAAGLKLNHLFVRLSQQAADTRRTGALKQVLDGLRMLANRRPELASALRPRVGLENRIPNLVDQAVKDAQPPRDVLDVLKAMPAATALCIAALFSRSTQRERSDRLAELARAMNAEGLAALEEKLQRGPDSEAISTVGLLVRLEAGSIAEHLAARLPRWNHSYQNLVVRQVASSGSARRGQLLLALLDLLDSLVLPPALDEIGMAGDASTAPQLLRIAEGQAPRVTSPFFRIKAIEALGRLRAADAAPLLRRLVEEKQLWMWTHPRELRVVALQALQRMEPAWVEKFMAQSDLSAEELGLAPLEAAGSTPGVRQRSYARFPVRQTLVVEMKVAKETFRLVLKDLSLGGGLAAGEIRLPAGSKADMTIGSGAAAIHATVLLRGVRKGGVSFEIVDITLEERSKLRKLLLELQKANS
jgi:hypothetical protein